MIKTFSLFAGWLLDLICGDPRWLPHPVVGFGKIIAFGEHRLNKGMHRKVKGAMMAIALIVMVFLVGWAIRHFLCLENVWLGMAFDTIIVFYCLAGTTLIREVCAVFVALDRSLEEGRRQVARIVGRDTSELSAQEAAARRECWPIRW